MSAVGQVKTGYSLPWVAIYTASGGSISYSSGIRLGRGVDASYDIETSDDNKFYADNIEAENESGTFQSGTLTLTIDGLLDATRKLIMGLPAADTSTGLTAYGDSQSIPECGVGYVFRYQNEGTVYYKAVIFPRVKFAQVTESGSTQEESIDWQTQELTAEIKRAEDANRNWCYIGDNKSSESAAETVIKNFFGVSSTPAVTT